MSKEARGIKRYIPPFKYYFPPKAIDFITSKIREILENHEYLTMGKYCEEFEEKFANYIGVKHAISVNSGTSALEIIFRAINVEGYEVIVPTNTFAATAFAVIRAGGKPVFADCIEDLTVDPNDVKKHITDKTKAIVTVHIGGLVSPHTHELIELCEDKGIYLVEDCAHAHGSMLDGKKAGTFGIAGAFSFFPTKVMTTGEGGMITTNDDDIANMAKLLRNQGKIKGNMVGVVAYNWRMTEFQAIMGLAQLSLLEEIIEKRTNIARIYDEVLKDNEVLRPLKIPENVRHNYYKYIVFLPKKRKPEVLREHLKKNYNISLSGYVYEIPLHKQPPFQKYVSKKDKYPRAEDLCSRHIALPIYPEMTPKEAYYVAESLLSSIKELGWQE